MKKKLFLETGTKARFDHPHKNRVIRCTLCPQNCRLGPNQQGTCGTRVSIGGQLVTITYGHFPAMAIDPIEKKPLFHYHAGSKTLSVGAPGCNLTCPFCQNSALSQQVQPDVPEKRWTPQALVQTAVDHQIPSISFTYSEPILCTEFILDIAPLAKEAGIDIIMVTNGQVQSDPRRHLAQNIQAANIDLKCVDPERHQSVLGGPLKPTLETIAHFRQSGVWVEVTTLVVPGFNDQPQQLRHIAQTLSAIDPHIPWHVSRYHPAFKYTAPKTDPQLVIHCVEMGLDEGLRYVYAGNLGETGYMNTRCPGCGQTVVNRQGYHVVRTRLKNGRCDTCDTLIAGSGW